MTNSKRPDYLKQGDSVGIVAPAGRVSAEQLNPAFDVIKSWGLLAVKGSHLFDSDGYFSGSDVNRSGDLQKMLDDPKIKAVFCVRGGYGITRIIDTLDFNHFTRNPKWIIGFSDITALHLKISLLNIQSIHGIMPIHFDPLKVEDSLASLRQLLFGEERDLEWIGNDNNISGRAEGYLRGGNLSLLADSIGTGSYLDGRNSILFFEEIDEYLYKVDRMLTQLYRAGVFDQARAVIVGNFSSMKDTKTPLGKSLYELFVEKVHNKNIPLAFGCPVGHDFPNMSLPHNRLVRLNVDMGKSKLSF